MAIQRTFGICASALLALTVSCVSRPHGPGSDSKKLLRYFTDPKIIDAGGRQCVSYPTPTRPNIFCARIDLMSSKEQAEEVLFLLKDDMVGDMAFYGNHVRVDKTGKIITSIFPEEVLKAAGVLPYVTEDAPILIQKCRTALAAAGPQGPQ